MSRRPLLLTDSHENPTCVTSSLQGMPAQLLDAQRSGLAQRFSSHLHSVPNAIRIHKRDGTCTGVSHGTIIAKKKRRWMN